MAKTKPEEIWVEYNKGITYMNRNSLFETVKINENFYDGRQWGDLEATTMPKPVFNILQRSGKYMVATIGSNDIAIQMTPFMESSADTDLIQPIKKEIESVIEQARIKEASKIAIRNAFVDGSAYMLQSFNPKFETFQDMKGRIENQLVDNTCVIFGNPYSRDIQTQPYIIIVMRQHISQVKKEAKLYGVPEDEIETIQPTNENMQPNDDSDELVTVLLKFYKEMKKEQEVKMDEMGNEEIIEKNVETVWFTKSTEHVTLIKPTDLGYRRYPIACFGWDIIKNSYLYNSPMTAVIPNQVFINKCYAIAQMYGLQSAFPKIVFDKAKVNIDEFLNSIDPQAVAGIDMAGKFIDFIKIPDFSNNIITLGQETISQTKDTLGVTDVSLGNVKPDNTSAIIALQESSNVPLEIQKQFFYEFWEDTVRNIIDIMANTYGVRKVVVDDELFAVDFSTLKTLNYSLSVEVGNGANFSEIAQINTLDKLMQAGLIDGDVYADIVPSKYIPQKQRVVQNIKQKLAALSQAGMQPQARGSTTLDENAPL